MFLILLFLYAGAHCSFILVPRMVKKEWTLTLAEIKVDGASLLTEHVQSLCKDSVF